MKILIFNYIECLVADLLYYDRKEDEDLPVGQIEALLEKGEITIDEMVSEFRMHLELLTSRR